MPISELDTYRSANILINQHGEDAAVHAAMNADELLAKGDVEGGGGGVEADPAGS